MIYLTKHQRRFVKNRSVLLNTLSIIKKKVEALDIKPNSENVVFYTDFLKILDKEPQYELIQITPTPGYARVKLKSW